MRISMKRFLFLLLLLAVFPTRGARAQMQGITVTVLQETEVSDTPDKVSITILATFILDAGRPISIPWTKDH